MRTTGTFCFTAQAPRSSTSTSNRTTARLPDEPALEGIIARLEKTYTETTSERTRARLIACMTDLPCPSCHGEKLNPAARSVTVGGLRLPEISMAAVHEPGWSARGGPTLKRARPRRGPTAPKCWTNGASSSAGRSSKKSNRASPSLTASASIT